MIAFHPMDIFMHIFTAILIHIFMDYMKRIQTLQYLNPYKITKVTYHLVETFFSWIGQVSAWMHGSEFDKNAK